MERLNQTLGPRSAMLSTNWRAGMEPVVGYRLVEPLGRGGFGEVWKCEAPGGLFKAIKAVNGNNGNDQLADQELEALQRIRLIRHPFILSVERIDVIGGVLLIVMELADKNLQVLHAESRARGQAGLGREELLELLAEAAEALDWMNFEHGLQHLDIKPQNLFLVSNHLKIADFGLVQAVSDKDGPSPYRQGGATPLYASPELLRGNISRHCDQYSLAIVYQQMLTGGVPFFSTDAHQLMMMHLSAEPDLSSLPPSERPLVARALSKDPEQRFSSCLEFMQHLFEGTGFKGTRAARALQREAKKDESGPDMTRRVEPLAEAPAENYKTSSLPLHLSEASRTPSLPPRGSDSSVFGSRFLPPPFESVPLSLPGYRLVKCMGQNPLGEFWLAQDNEGREFRALCLSRGLGADDKLIHRLRAIQHPKLPPVRVMKASAERLAVIHGFYQGSLRDRFETCRASGLPGIPRLELLGYLRCVAETLDALHAQWKVPHLALNPRSVLLEDGQAWLADYGLVQMLWMPTGQTAAQLNPRYAAPELLALLKESSDDGVSSNSPAVDQYALALVYAEMLAGFHPRSLRPRTGSGSFRRPSSWKTTARSGDTPVPDERIDLDMVVASDRRPLARALSMDPGERFSSCTAFVQALEEAVGDLGNPSLNGCTPRIIACAELLGEETPANLVVPGMGQMLADLNVRSDFRVVTAGAKNARYLFHREGFWEYKCPIQVFPTSLRLKLDGFRQYWKAKPVQQGEWLSVYHLEFPRPETEAGRSGDGPFHVEVRIQVRPLRGKTVGMSESRVSIRPVWERGSRVARVLEQVAPQIFESLRSFLQASPEQRIEERLPFAHPVRAFPVRDGHEVGQPIDGICEDISRTGIRFRVNELLPADEVYLNWPRIARVAPFALLARVVRVRKIEGVFDIGAIFNGPLL